MEKYIIVRKLKGVGVLTLNRPEKLNAWNAEMRGEIIAALKELDGDAKVAAIVMTGAGRAFSAGQDLAEAHDFDASRAVEWIGEWENYYSAIRNLSKPIVMALNGAAAGSAFQVALLGDVRVAHPGVRMGQPEINSGIASTLGPWLMSEMLGLSRMIELTLTGRLMDGEECHRIGLVHHLVPEDRVLCEGDGSRRRACGKAARRHASRQAAFSRNDRSGVQGRNRSRQTNPAGILCVGRAGTNDGRVLPPAGQ